MKRRPLLWTVAGVCLVFVAALALLAGLARHRPESERTETTREGEWEVPVVEGHEQSETFVLAKNKHLRIKVLEDVHDFYSGDEVTVRWEPGKVYVNDILVVPVPIEREILPAAEVMERYGKIPTVQEYIAEHRGEASEDTVATEAMEAWFEREQTLLRQVSDRYIDLLNTRSPRDAAEIAANMIRASGLADSVAVRDTTPSESEAQELDVVWQGERGRPGWIVGVSLRPWRSELPPPTVTAKRVYVHLKGEVNRLTYGDNTLTVRFENGNLFLEGDLVPKPMGGQS
jgi:predicted nucleotidyltransferase